MPTDGSGRDSVMTINVKRFIRMSLLRTLAVMLAWVALVAVVSCSPQSSDESKVEPVSQTPPKLTPMPAAVPPLVARPPVASEGDCAPRYANGSKGTCINNQPCRGFGVRADDGSAVCTCFGLDGGCREGQRCDPQKLACLPEKEPPFGRPVTR